MNEYKSVGVCAIAPKHVVALGVEEFDTRVANGQLTPVKKAGKQVKRGQLLVAEVVRRIALKPGVPFATDANCKGLPCEPLKKEPEPDGEE